MPARVREQFSEREQGLLASLTEHGPGFYALVGLLGAVIAWGFIAYAMQLRYGLGVTGLRDHFMWGVYITNFVFFIGVSHVGALMSAILRITGAEWRRSVTRMAEAITFASLLMGALMPFVDMGRPDRILNLLLHGRLQSPVLWDILSISTYLTGSTLFLYVPMIPDIALLRDRFADGPAWRRRLYTILSLGWRGTEAQRHHLERIMGIMAIIIIPIAISVHTVVSWIFGMTLRAGWNSTVFGPYFVSGALFSGAAAVVTAMAAFRWAYHLEEYIEKKHFVYLSYILVTLALGYTYFLFSEYLTEGYKMHEPGGALLELMLTGRLAPFFWLFSVGGLILPILLIALPYTRTIPGITVASLAVVLGMWLKRFLIVVPGLAEPQIASDVTIYWPTMVEVSITVAAAAAIPLMMLLFFRVFPIISIYEVEESVLGHPQGLGGSAEAE